MARVLSGRHRFALGALRPQNSSAAGSRAVVDERTFPVLDGMALAELRLAPGGIRGPHWHPNASELAHCVEGRAVMTIFGPDAVRDTFTLEAGDLAFVPRGYLHHLENAGDGEARFLLCYNAPQPQDIELAGSTAMADSIMSATFGVGERELDAMRGAAPGDLVTPRPPGAPLPTGAATSRFKLALDGTAPRVEAPGGSVWMGRRDTFAVLDGLACYSLLLRPGGGREPHWHPNANELHYVRRGRVAVTLLSPGGDVDTFELGSGDIGFMPRGFFHSIENVGGEDSRLAVFFDHESPSDIGVSGSFGAFSAEVLASVFGVPVEALASFPRFSSDLVVVGGRSPDGIRLSAPTDGPESP